MTQFEFIFIPYSLILGLSMIALLGGLGRSLKMSLKIETSDESYNVGFLTPLLAMFVMLDLLSFWIAAWVIKDMLTISTITLLSVTSFASCYYLAAYLVFPDQLNKQTDFDQHYFRVKKIVYALLLILTVAQLTFYAMQPAILPNLLNPYALTLTSILLSLLIAGMIAKSKKANYIILCALILRYLISYLS